MNWHIPVPVYGTRSCRNAHVKQNVRKNTKWFSLSQLNTMTSIKKRKKVSFSDIHHPWVCTSGEQIYHWEKPHAFETYIMYSQSLCLMDKPDNNLICGFAILFYYFFSSRRTNEIARIFFFSWKKQTVNEMYSAHEKLTEAGESCRKWREYTSKQDLNKFNGIFKISDI